MTFHFSSFESRISFQFTFARPLREINEKEGIKLYFLAIFSSHMAAFGTLYELKLHFAEHITKIPLGYHLTIGSGRLRKIMDENIESIEGFIAHQFPDFVASVTAPIVMVIILIHKYPMILIDSVVYLYNS